ncbi:class II aldolase/adducin family protein [Pseudoclavibacter terrae]|uniref:Aldolase n=1 Tax=Pseudoclavibacter terrae TaxID=1530195 RepID=A0A7J5B0T4_9MICO|nr:class II aldolase/adducin family protein [Pseudoclavibacter terrae]KAB1637528.1 aldolase [Pseudoclavibacter terrae]
MSDLVDELIEAGRLLAEMGLSPGSSGNVSVRLGNEIWMSASGTTLGALNRTAFARVSVDGEPLDPQGPKATKEAPLHLAMYERDPAATCVVHLHSPNAVAASCLAPWRAHSALEPITPYLLMRVGNVPLVPYAAPGDPTQAAAVRTSALEFHGALLQNHGSIVSGSTVAQAVDRAIEIEEAARTRLLVGGREDLRPLTDDEVQELVDRYGQPWGDG